MSDYRMKTGKVGETVINGYKAIEKGVVDGYQKIEDGVVGAYRKVERKFVETFLEDEDDTNAGGPHDEH